MSKELTREEVAIMIQARRLLKDKGFAADADVSTICKTAGISRKTGYQWAAKYSGRPRPERVELQKKMEQLDQDYTLLKKKYKDLNFENEGRKVSWEIHEVDALLGVKKNTSPKGKKKKR